MTNPYTPELRREHTIRFIKFMASLDRLHLIRPAHLAATYHGMTEAQIEAAMVLHLPEECAK